MSRKVFYSYLCSVLLFPAVLYAHPEIESRLELLNQEIAKNTDSAELRLQRSEVHREHRDWEKALSDIEHVLRQYPRQHLAYFVKAKLEKSRGNNQAALQAVNSYLDFEKTNPEAYILRASLLRESGEFRKAANDLDTAISATANPSPDLYVDRALCLRLLGPESSDEEIRGLIQGVTTNGPIVTLLVPLIERELATGQTAAALGHWGLLPQTLQEQPVWIAKRAEILAADGQSEEAQRWFLQAEKALNSLPPRRRDIGQNKAVQLLLEQKLRPR
jgi:tetratricopeptide (TPR) repeat protein